MNTPPPVAARTILDIAAEVEADEQRLKRRLIECAKIRECDRMVEALEVWLASPAVEAIRKLDPCPPPEVTPPGPPQE